MKSIITLCYLLFMVSAFSSCGGNFTGDYSGLETFTGSLTGSQTLDMALVQNGQTITGSFQSASGGSATIFGTVSGDTITNFAITSSSGLCLGTLYGTAYKGSNNGLSGSVSGTSNCGFVTLSFSLTKKTQ